MNVSFGPIVVVLAGAGCGFASAAGAAGFASAVFSAGLGASVGLAAAGATVVTGVAGLLSAGFDSAGLAGAGAEAGAHACASPNVIRVPLRARNRRRVTIVRS